MKTNTNDKIYNITDNMYLPIIKDIRTALWVLILVAACC